MDSRIMMSVFAAVLKLPITEQLKKKITNLYKQEFST